MQMTHFIAEQNTSVACNDPGAEFGAQSLSKRNHIPIGIDDVKVGRMRLLWLVEVSSRCDWHCRIKMNQRAPLRCIILGQKLVNRHVYELRIADIAVAIRNRQTHYFADHVKIFRRVMAQSFELKALEKI